MFVDEHTSQREQMKMKMKIILGRKITSNTIKNWFQLLSYVSPMTILKNKMNKLQHFLVFCRSNGVSALIDTSDDVNVIKI